MLRHSRILLIALIFGCVLGNGDDTWFSLECVASTTLRVTAFPNGHTVRLRPDDGSWNQQWNATYDDRFPGAYSLINRATGLALFHTDVAMDEVYQEKNELAAAALWVDQPFQGSQLWRTIEPYSQQGMVLDAFRPHHKDHLVDGNEVIIFPRAPEKLYAKSSMEAKHSKLLTKVFQKSTVHSQFMLSVLRMAPFEFSSFSGPLVTQSTMTIVRSSSLLLLFAIFLLSSVSELQDLLFYSRSARLLHKSAALHCSAGDGPSDRGRPPGSRNSSAGVALCPRYFARIHEHLAPWRSTGITRRSLDRLGSMRVAILRSDMYVSAYGDCPQSRRVFSLWGLLLMLERFGDRVPDVEFVLNCKDRPIVPRDGSEVPAPVLSYCSHRLSLDIPFPDYSFWGWPEVNIRPWEEESQEIFQGSQDVEWSNRQPFAFWKGNLRMGKLRTRLARCNSTKFGTLVLDQNWIDEANTGYENSNLCKQCNQRYNIYAEGAAWSASLKYKMACGSTLLYLDSEYDEFFTKGLLPNIHFLPISSKEEDMCGRVGKLPCPSGPEYWENWTGFHTRASKHRSSIQLHVSPSTGVFETAEIHAKNTQGRSAFL